MTEINHIETLGRKIIYKGIGKMFYEEGMPIEMSVKYFKEKGFEVSPLHIADELLKTGWSEKRVIACLLADGLGDLTVFCNSSYEDQREMIFQYLWGSTSDMFISGELKMKNVFQ